MTSSKEGKLATVDMTRQYQRYRVKTEACIEIFVDVTDVKYRQIWRVCQCYIV